MSCNCTPSTIDGIDFDRLPSWELVLREAAHGHYTAPATVVADAVREIDRLRGSNRDG